MSQPSPLDTGSIRAPDDDPSAKWPHYTLTTAQGRWEEDILGVGFSYTTLPMGHDDEGELCATLVRYLPPQSAPENFPPGKTSRLTRLIERFWPPAAARSTTRTPPSNSQQPTVSEHPGFVLAVHGWSDYFYNTEMAAHWAARGFAFYALDLRRYGRSLRAHHLNPGFTLSLDEYDADLDAALAMIRSLEGHDAPGVCVAHSTGGLIASLWVNRNPEAFDALILNSPWLEMQGSYLVRYAAQGVVEPIARRRPRAKLHLPELDNYWRSLSRLAHGHWDLHPLWRPQIAFPVTAGWITAVMAGHREVARGLDIRIPILVLTSKTTHLGTSFDEAMLHSDSVLEVNVVRERSLKLGREVTNAVINGSMHDVFSSLPQPRAAAYAAMDRWSSGYVRGLLARDNARAKGHAQR
jgi:alpha-beta hydrolase superfamily lysophospholipase